jgi:hypothetical protein
MSHKKAPLKESEKFLKPLSFEFIFAIVIALINFALDQADVHVLLITWLTLVLAAVLLIDGFRRTEWIRKLGYKSVPFFSSCLLICLAFVAFGWYLWGHKPKKPVKDASKVATAHISAQLVIDSSEKDSTDYRFIVENGPVPISEVKVSAKTPQSLFAIFVTSPRQNMAPGDKQEVHFLPIHNNDRPLSLQLLVTFKALDEERYVTFDFFIDSKKLSSQPYFPVGSEEGLGDGKQTEDALQAASKQFQMPTGEVMLAFPELDLSERPNQLRLKAKHREILISSVTRRAMITAITSSGEYKIAEEPFAPNPGSGPAAHTVTVTWDDHKQIIGIAVDGSPLLTR